MYFTRWIFLGAIVLRLAALEGRTATFAWSGATNGFWSTPTNWLGELVPVSADDTRLEFTSSTNQLIATNDLASGTIINTLVTVALTTNNVELRNPGSSPRTLRLAGTTASIRHTGGGNPGQLVIRMPLILDAETSISNLGGANLLNLAQNVEGIGPLKVAAGRVIIQSPGVLRPTNGTIVAATGELWVGDASGTPRVQSAVTVQPGGAVSLTPRAIGAAPLRIAGSGKNSSPKGALHTDRSINSGGASAASWTGPITLDGPATIATRDGVLTLSGGVNLNGHTLTIGDPTNGTGHVFVERLGLTGTGGLTVNGGSLQMSASSFTGPILVNGASMSFSESTNIGSIVVNGGRLSLVRSAFPPPILVQSNGVLSVVQESDLGAAPNPFVLDNGAFSMGFRTLSAAHPFTLGSGGGMLFFDNNSVIDAAISGPGKLSLGRGTLTLNGLSSYGGGTEVNGGTVIVSADRELGGPGGPVILNEGQLSLEDNFSLDPTRAIITADGTISFKFGSVIGSPISGSGRLTLIRRSDAIGQPVITLTETNTQNGLRIFDIVVRAAATANLGDPAGTLELAQNGQLRLLAPFDLGPTGTNIYDGRIDTGGHAMTILRPGFWKSLTKLGGGVLTLAASNSLGVSPKNTVTRVEGGTLRVATPGAVPFGGSVVLLNSSQLDLNGFDYTFTSINSVGGSLRLAGANLLLIGGGSIDEGVIGPGAVAVQQSRLILRGLCSQTSTTVGTTDLTSVTPSLQIDSAMALGVAGAPITLINGARLGTSPGPNPITIDATHGVQFDGGGGFSTGGQLVVEGVVSGSGGFSVIGGGTVALTNPSNSFSGTIVVNDDSTLRIGHDDVLGVETNRIHLGRAPMNGGSSEVSGGILQAASDVTLPATRRIELAGASQKTGVNRLDSQAFIFTIDGDITESQGGGNLIKLGTGTLRLNGLNRISDKLVIQQGTLAGTGTVQNLRLHAGTTLAPGNGLGTFHAANVEWQVGAALAFELGSGAASARLEVAGALTGDTDTPRQFVFRGKPELTTYTLITGGDGGDLSTDFELEDFTFTGPTGLTGTFAVDNAGVKFTVTGVAGGGGSNSDVIFQLLSRTSAGTTLRIMPSQANRIYELLASKNLAPASWETVTNASFAPTVDGQWILDPDLISTQKFYRLRIKVE